MARHPSIGAKREVYGSEMGNRKSRTTGLGGLVAQKGVTKLPKNTSGEKAEQVVKILAAHGNAIETLVQRQEQLTKAVAALSRIVLQMTVKAGQPGKGAAERN
jgi:hypothetical protein